MNIFVTVGTQPQCFDRLLKAIQKLDNKYNFMVQKGNSDLVFNQEFTFDYDIVKYVSQADLIITHAGVGSIMKALEYNKSIIVVPRLEKYGEHVNDHQLQMCDYVSKNNFGAVCHNISQLEDLILTEKFEKRNSFISNNKHFNQQLINLINGGI